MIGIGLGANLFFHNHGDIPRRFAKLPVYTVRDRTPVQATNGENSCNLNTMRVKERFKERKIL